MNTGASTHLNDLVISLSDVFNTCIYPSVSVGDGQAIPVTNTGHSILPTPHRPLHLNNVLITLHIVKNLIYVRQFIRDNNYTIKFDAFRFYVKDFMTRRVLLRCDSMDSLGMFLYQKKYVVEIIKKVHMVNCNPSWTPVDIESKLGTDGEPVFAPTLYWSLACSLQSFSSTTMEDTNHICTLGDYSRPSHEGYRNIIELPEGSKGKECDCVYFKFPFMIKLAIGLNVFQQDPSLHMRILLLISLVNSFHREGLQSSVRTSLCSNNIKESLSLKHGLVSRTYFKKSLIMASTLASNSIFYDHVSFHLKCEIDRASGDKHRDKNADESWEITENLTLYDHEGWNDSKDSIKLVKDISTPQSTSKTPDRRLLELEDHINFLLKGSRPTLRSSSTCIPQAYVKAQEEINNRMTEMFGILKELTTSKAPKKGQEEKNEDDNAMNGDSIERPDGSDVEMPLKEVEKENKAKNRTKNKPIKITEKELTRAEEEEAVETTKLTRYDLKNHRHMNTLVDKGSDVNIIPFSTYKKLTEKRPAETDIRLSLASHSYIYPLGIADDVLVNVAGYMYLIDFVILDIKADEKRPFILGTPFLTTAKAVIKFDKGTITLRTRKSKISFHWIPEFPCKIERGIKNDIEPIAPTMIVNILVLE
nr:ribonuclease H-like domain-containing protein [Tanacetum cinerariifolium]GEX61180.1 ribonuclease H-like domain-containing protein [Tanacetum cinerariifolium]